MAERKIDYDKGVIIRTAANFGMDVFMYRQNPGVYYNAHGDKVGEGIAKMAGFDVDKYSKLRRRKLAVAAATSAADAELLASEAVDQSVVVREKDGYKIIALGSGRHLVKDPEGNVLTQGVVLTLQMAEKVLDEVISAMVPEMEAPVAKVAESPAALGVRAGAGRMGATPLRTG
jgi:hypothetical protein